MSLDPKYKAVSFDMDSTFMDTKVDYMKLANIVFDELSESGVPESCIIRTGGPKSELDSGMKWLRENGKGKEIDTLPDRIADRSTRTEMEYADCSKPFDGAVETVLALRNKGYKTAILTRGGHSYAEYVLRRSNVSDIFDAVVGRDDFPEDEAKPSPKAMVNLGNILGLQPEEILFLGDHKIDWMTARDSGAGFMGVLTGWTSLEDWAEMDPDIPVIDSVASLLDLI
ncbi:MAG: HAD family hydrolase [Candidatus Methanoplasma sp.]|jgi:phosphoglycolate phosphatase|nr:HAD family hydrolase [Candidatus Methanoplasma sp.]